MLPQETSTAFPGGDAGLHRPRARSERGVFSSLKYGRKQTCLHLALTSMGVEGSRTQTDGGPVDRRGHTGSLVAVVTCSSGAAWVVLGRPLPPRARPRWALSAAGSPASVLTRARERWRHSHVGTVPLHRLWQPVPPVFPWVILRHAPRVWSVSRAVRGSGAIWGWRCHHTGTSLLQLGRTGPRCPSEPGGGIRTIPRR